MDFLVSEGMSEGTLPFSLKIFDKKIWPISTSWERTISVSCSAIIAPNQYDYQDNKQ